MAGELKSTTVTVELNVGNEKDVDKDANNRMLEVVTLELNVESEEDVDKDTNDGTIEEMTVELYVVGSDVRR